MSALELFVRPDGSVACIYPTQEQDELDFLDLVDALGGGMKRRRASEVEPAEDGAGWTADMARVSGPVLGPFRTRREALDREVEWLLANNLGGASWA